MGLPRRIRGPRWATRRKRSALSPARAAASLFTGAIALPPRGYASSDGTWLSFAGKMMLFASCGGVISRENLSREIA